MAKCLYAVKFSDACSVSSGDFGVQIDNGAQTIFVPLAVFEFVCQKAVTSAPDSLHLLSLVECYPSHVASCLGWTSEEALAAAGKLREDMAAHGLDVPEPPPSFARGANPPPSIPEP